MATEETQQVEPTEIGPVQLLAGAIVSNGGALSITFDALNNQVAYEGKVIQIDVLTEKRSLVLTLGEADGN